MKKEFLTRFQIAALALFGVFTPFTLSAQNQTNYSGTNATGLLTLSGTTNLTALAQAQSVSNVKSKAAALRTLGASKVTTSLPEIPKTLPKTLPPPGRAQSILLRPLGAQHTTSLAVLGANIAAVSNTHDLNVVPGVTTVGFSGVSETLQRAANNGNQFSVEPPNPAIAVAHGYVLEGVNNAIQIYDTSGNALLAQVLSTNQLFGLPPAVDRSTGIYGPYPTDMRVFYDSQVDRWFVMQRAQDEDVFGDALVTSHLYLAVSQTADPTGTYNIYTAETTDSTRAGCPCLLDYPQLGADQYGFYISANEFDSATQLTFVDATVLAISKAALAAGVPSPTMYRFAVPYSAGYEFALLPASTPPGASNFVASGGVEYLASTVGSYSGSSVAVWAITNTSSLGTQSPSPQLAQIVVPTALAYSVPESATQKTGPTPYLSSQGYGEPFIDAGDTRIQALVYSGGRLYMTFVTGASDQLGNSVVGGAYLVLSPTLRSNNLKATILQQNVLVVPGNNLLRPAVGVNAKGQGSITATLVGADYFPSAAFVPITVSVTPTLVRLVAPGLAPEDGFTGEGSPARWGDMATAVVAADGTVWSGVEYIGHVTTATPPPPANWDTFIMQTQP